jgi:hypothetical protein
MSDIIASGSNDGYVRIWNANADSKTIKPIKQLPVNGFVNGLYISKKIVVAGTGCEHKYGRWWRMKGPLNKVVVMRYNEITESDNSFTNDEEDDSSENSSDDESASSDESISENRK